MCLHRSKTPRWYRISVFSTDFEWPAACIRLLDWRCVMWTIDERSFDGLAQHGVKGKTSRSFVPKRQERRAGDYGLELSVSIAVIG